MKNKLGFTLLLLLLLACQPSKKPAISFYYWKTIFELNPKEQAVLAQNNVQKLYVRYFDLTLDVAAHQVYPTSPIHFKTPIKQFTVVPVVYIKNQIFLDSTIVVKEVAHKTADLITRINTANGIACQEIQLDCDWTLRTKERYLEFVEVFKRASQKRISATIRLHQVKYFKKTKIPNVDSGVLMYYNMGKIAPDSLNSIYDRNIAEKYLESLKKYPLPLNFALPIYSWFIHIQNQKVIGVRAKLSVANLVKDKNFKRESEKYFRVIQSNYKNGVFYQENDILKLEAISSSDLLEMASDLQEKTKESPSEILFYDLDQFNFNNYEKSIFEQVIAVF
ncbi:hypothetical protein [Flavobacterium sp.]|uniref:hypothetical protein n=1 Tax=Flavobacterium sp. TaxID=239 RepID=UPI00261E3B34|nr:hypothetical protein [Flavobacterium sp.]